MYAVLERGMPQLYIIERTSKADAPPRGRGILIMYQRHKEEISPGYENQKAWILGNMMEMLHFINDVLGRV